MPGPETRANLNAIAFRFKIGSRREQDTFSVHNEGTVQSRKLPDGIKDFGTVNVPTFGPMA